VVASRQRRWRDVREVVAAPREAAVMVRHRVRWRRRHSIERGGGGTEGGDGVEGRKNWAA
jgi:hypothetical protein